eukprot:1895012-Pyramimonas_sp.AAC.1
MLGDAGQPRLHAKAAETRYLVPLLLELCSENAAAFANGANVYIPPACRSLLAFHQIIERNPRQMPVQSQRDMEAR